jgi:hypothetical protein
MAYGVIESGGGFILAGFYLVLGIFFLFFKKSVNIDQSQYACFLNMFLFGVMIGVVSSVLKANPSGFFRFTIYFNYTVIFLWPIVFKNTKDRLSKFIIGYLFVLGYLVFFALTTERFSDLVPYKFNPLFFIK